MYDVNSSGTASQHRAPYGNSYNINLFERPFTQKDMTYIPSLDINTFQITSDDNFYYVFITLIGNNPNDPANIDYGVEIDKDHDGFGDVLVWAQPPYTTAMDNKRRQGLHRSQSRYRRRFTGKIGCQCNDQRTLSRAMDTKP